MSVNENTLCVGKCYVTRQGQVRRITSIREGFVDYVARETQPESAQWPAPPLSVLPSAGSFALAVDDEVACDWQGDKNSN